MELSLDLCTGHSSYEEKEIRVTGDTKWHTALKLPFNVPTGRYRIGWNHEWFISYYYNCRMLVRIQVDGIIMGDSRNTAIVYPAHDQGWNPGCGFGYIDLEEGDHVASIAVALTQRNREIGIRRRCLELWRVK